MNTNYAGALDAMTQNLDPIEREHCLALVHIADTVLRAPMPRVVRWLGMGAWVGMTTVYAYGAARKKRDQMDREIEVGSLRREAAYMERELARERQAEAEARKHFADGHFADGLDSPEADDEAGAPSPIPEPPSYWANGVAR